MKFDYVDRANEYRASLPGGYTVRAVRDEDCENPWQAWDGQPPCVVQSDGFTVYKEIPNPLADVSDSWIARHWRALCDIYGASHEEAARFREDNGGTVADARRDLLDIWGEDSKPGNYGGREHIKTTEAFCNLRAWPCYRATSRCAL